jgi:hypothetical protein
VDCSAHIAPVDSEIVIENFVVAALEIITEKPSKGDAWICQRLQPLSTQKKSRKTEFLPTQKSSTKLLAQVTR